MIVAGPWLSSPPGSAQRPGGNSTVRGDGPSLEHRGDQQVLAQQELIMDLLIPPVVVGERPQDRLAAAPCVGDQLSDHRQQRLAQVDRGADGRDMMIIENPPGASENCIVGNSAEHWANRTNSS